MRRRQFTAAVAGSTVLLAGCMDGGGTIVDEQVTEGTIFSLELEAGSTVVIELTNNEGQAAFVTLRGPEGSPVLSEGTETSDTFRYEVEADGTHELQVTPDERATVVVTVE